MSLQVLSVASEAVPWVKTGGLADVAGALPAALAPHGVAMTAMIPGYRDVLGRLGKRPRTAHKWPDLFGGPARLLAKDGMLVLDAPHLFDRPGRPYGDDAGHDWPDNWRRFAAFARAAADVAGGAAKGLRFDLLHAHDWQAGLAPAYLRFAPVRPGAAPVASVMTIHNMAFQGYFPAEIFPQLGLPKQAWAMDGVEYHGGVGLLKAGLESASAITTVSPTYAREIRQPDFGMGLDGLIRSRAAQVHGIVNGIDTAEWDPARDPALVQRFDAASLAGRAANRAALEAEFGLAASEGPLFIVVSRLTWQKGMDVLLEALDHLVWLGGRLALLGTGDAALEAGFHAAAARHPGRIGVRIGYDEALSHRMQAGGDAILVPSRFEPCGLTQLYGLRYGCVPVVARTGGLADTVIDANVAALAIGAATGIQFDGITVPALKGALDRALALWHAPEDWQAVQRAGMAQDFSWHRSAGAYAALYRRILG
ncbi:glycogen synthase GlgA [Novosphingobium piscinae]|uniref:Glycogen synthase n=1 Tax=Novosphingobium piscinae TaxID=1507448 RepID=A0A7X1KP44_9SPHN|nr:glycogen synthase GlgA [Novosphingobium piscinae]MBC2668098.1 glycogen synthase GlgA [Novosphingobium piscinae]